MLFNTIGVLCYLLGLVTFSSSGVKAQGGNTSQPNVAEADLLWPRDGDTFALNNKGMAMVVAIQNYAEAEKYGWLVTWLMCQNRTDQPGFRKCAFKGEFNDSRIVLRNDSAVDERGIDDNGSDIYIEINHSYWYSGIGSSGFDYLFGGVYTFEWRFDIGPWCEFTNNSTTYGSSKTVNGGVFNVTLVPSASYPTPTPSTCGSILGAVSYSAATTYSFHQSVANEPGCIETQPVTISPTPCRATLNTDQLATVAAYMGWDQSNPNTTTSAELPAETNRSLASAREVGRLGIFVTSLLTFMLGRCLWL